MKILVINCGSSSIKFQFIETKNQKVLAKGLVERIGEEISYFTYKSENIKLKDKELMAKDHTRGIKLIFNQLADKESGVIRSKHDINAVGHRLVHGGEEFSGSVLIDEEVMQSLYDCVELAPLHNPN